ncbi:MAG: ROK family protein [Bacteroidaceae bacterium]|nr:ROK family protein [Bacteroidaceae bacterium]MBR1788968.1 ROK family protein [Bacteroidaceae bacterium]
MDQNEKPYVIGLDLGGTNSVFGIVDANANVVAETSVKTKGHGDNVELYVEDCLTALRKIIDQVGGIGKIRAMGIGAPNGNYYTGCIEFAPNLPWAKGVVPLAKMFSDALGIPVAMTNDANAAAIGEMTYGAAKGMKNFIMITLGTGVGSGIVVNGQMVYGCDGMAGELGHVIVEKNGRECGCGRKGCLETYCSATGVARTAREIITSTDRPTLLREIPLDQIESKDVSIAAAKGDEVAKEIFEFTGRILGEACANFATFNSPEAFIFFGGLMKAGDLLLNPIKRAYDETVLKIYRGKAKMLVSQLDDAKAAVLGASALGWEIAMETAVHNG